MEKFIIDNKIYCLFSKCDNMQGIVIYCHGYGDNKERIYQHDSVLNNNGYGIISFDFPCHGEDKTDCIDFTYDLCMDYIDKVVKYIKNNYQDIPISIIGSSFGGYLTLNYINDKRYLFKKVFLKYPAVNFYECTKRKLKIDDDFFNQNEYYELPSGYRLYKQFYFESKEHDIMLNFNKCKNDIYIIHGNCDETVLIDDVIKFAKKNKITLNIVDGATHGMKDHLDLVNNQIISFFKI